VNADVLIVGAGPAGLAAAAELRRLGVARVLVAEREAEAGGVPRHCAHSGFGLPDLRRLMSGPGYARRMAAIARQAGAQVRCATTVTELEPARGPAGAPPPGPAGEGPAWRATLTSPDGIEPVTARAVVLATGCRERPRPARLVPGDRPAGVMTTGELQQRVHLHGQRIGGRALVVGAEHVSFSAILTLARAGARVIALVTDRPRHQSYAAFRLGAAALWRVPVWTSAAVTGIVGRDRVTAVELTDLATGAARRVECETVVFTGDWIGDHELARLAGALIDPGSRGPAVDQAGRTSVPGLFAAGGLVHPGETAGTAALGGRHVARLLAALLGAGRVGERPAGEPRPPGQAGPAGEPGPGGRPGVPVRAEGHLAWVVPQLIGPGDACPGEAGPAGGRFLARAADGLPRRARVRVAQDDRLLASFTLRLPPGRCARLPAGWARGADLAGGPVRITAR